MQEGFEEKYKDKIQMLERRVEEDYISRLQTQCFRERQYSKYKCTVPCMYDFTVQSQQSHRIFALQA